jgi:hypothetical protein
MTTPFPFTQGQVLTAAQMNAITTLPINDQTASYVALVGDVGKRIVMNVASANTVTINNSVFATGDTIFISSKGAGATTVTAGAGVTINTAGSLVIAQHGGGTLVATSASVFTFFPSGGIGYGVATGGTSSSITVSGVNYTLLTFSSGSSTMTVTKAGLFDVLCIGGGGGSISGFSTGGGGGGFQTATFYVDANQTIVVGAGGAASSSVVGGTSQFGTFLSCGGGGSCDTGADTSLCGASNGGVRTSGPASRNFTVGQGTGGVTGRGGSGAGATQSGDTGGVGKEVNTFISGSSLVLANGGSAGTAAAGAANTGNGGGGSGSNAGGSGVVYVRFKV